MPGFVLVGVHASAGQASADYQYYVSKDGKNDRRGQLLDVSQNPYKPQLES